MSTITITKKQLEELKKQAQIEALELIENQIGIEPEDLEIFITSR